MGFSLSRDYHEYILEYIMVIKSKNSNRYDMKNHKIWKFLFYNFNSFLNRINKSFQLIRYTTIADSDYTLAIIQEKYWLYFIEKILLLSKSNPLEIESLGTAADINKSKLIIDTMANWDFVKAVYNGLYRTAADNLTESLALYPMIKLHLIIANVNRNRCVGIDFESNCQSDEMKRPMISFSIFMIVSRRWKISYSGWQYTTFY